MNRNKWKTNSDKKLENVLGMKIQTAKGKLERLMILDAYRKLGMGNCHRCGFSIDSVEEMSIEHKRSYGGNVAKGIESNPDLFWDLDNICLSHYWCNCSAGCGGSGAYKYTGIHNFHDTRGNKNYHYIRAEITIKGKSKVLGCYKTQEEAAIAYDIGNMVYRNGRAKLNFESLRDDYISILKDHDTSDPDEFFNLRKSPVKDIVGRLYQILILTKTTDNKDEAYQEGREAFIKAIVDSHVKE